MVERMVVATIFFACAAAAAAGCAAPEASPDGSVVVAPDAPRNTDFRDAAECGGGGSGSGSGSGCGSGSGSGSGAPVDAPPCDAVTFRYQDAAATSVWVTGSFTSWATTPPGARALANDGAGSWSLTTQVGAGRQMYKLIVDGNRWIVDPANPVTAPDGFGGQNSVVVTCEAMPPG